MSRFCREVLPQTVATVLAPKRRRVFTARVHPCVVCIVMHHFIPHVRFDYVVRVECAFAKHVVTFVFGWYVFVVVRHEGEHDGDIVFRIVVDDLVTYIQVPHVGTEADEHQVIWNWIHFVPGLIGHDVWIHHEYNRPWKPTKDVWNRRVEKEVFVFLRLFNNQLAFDVAVVAIVHPHDFVERHVERW